MMNLGDGLMFELENGKPKLVLAHNAESKASNKTGFCQVSQKTRPPKTTATSNLGPKEDQRDRGHKNAGGVHHVEHDSQKIRTKSRTDGCSATKQESLVCLTHEQLLQLLNTIKASGRNSNDDSAAHIENDAATEEEATETWTSSPGVDLHVNSQGKENEEKTPSEFTPSGLFSTFGEREQKKDTIKAKKAQWRRELDEQMALKKQQKERTKVQSYSERRRGAEAGNRSSDQRSGLPEDRTTHTGTEMVNRHPPDSHSHKNTKVLPSAIRSAFVLGEAAPLDHAFSREKKEQQRRWLQDLEQQREEDKLRRKLEKQSQSQPEDHERWAMHFDSFQKHLTVQHSPAAELNLGSTLSHQRTSSQAMSTAQETVSAHEEDSMGRASVVTTQDFQPKTSYLRTMTALLDPAQMEAREQRRMKQLEHQRAIEAQMAEQRRQKEKEEAARQATEQQEERRVAKEREDLQQQHLRETQLQRQKEELASHKTEELYQSMQRASEEALKDKRLQRIKNLQKKGHDVSNLLRAKTNSHGS